MSKYIIKGIYLLEWGPHLFLQSIRQQTVQECHHKCLDTSHLETIPTDGGCSQLNLANEMQKPQYCLKTIPHLTWHRHGYYFAVAFGMQSVQFRYFTLVDVTTPLGHHANASLWLR